MHTVVLYAADQNLLLWAAEYISRKERVSSMTDVQNAGAGVYFIGMKLHASRTDVARIVTKKFKKAVRVKK